MVYYSESQKMVDAIENGKIVRVNEVYAKREGLVILRNSKQLFGSPEAVDKVAKMKQEEMNHRKFGIENFRKPLRAKNQVVHELIDNFHWNIVSARKARNMGRKQLATALGVSENVVKMLENGILPSDDFVLINKVQDYFKINLRKDGKDFISSPVKSVPPRYKLELDKPGEKAKESKPSDKVEQNADDLDIEIID